MNDIPLLLPEALLVDGVLWFSGFALFAALVICWFITGDDIHESCFGSCENCFNEHCDGCPPRSIE